MGWDGLPVRPLPPTSYATIAIKSAAMGFTDTDTHKGTIWGTCFAVGVITPTSDSIARGHTTRMTEPHRDRAESIRGRYLGSITVPTPTIDSPKLVHGA